MRNALILLVICLGVTITSCTVSSDRDNHKDMLIEGDFQFIQIYADINKQNSSTNTIREKQTIEQIIDRINNSKSESAEGMAYEKGPEGLLILKGPDEFTTKVPFFKDSGDVLYSDYLIHSTLQDILPTSIPIEE
ncbi:hypothetical protein [Paenibacillus lemnae]|uniref:Lipoprotein n=1 Tax=Paenibacillus lemnae TaxID=1330551 RepID=A0A848M2F0_PAELE|nr:hypothetical protein [Paenibacillus lemnae]NMO94736.1 hypothetical protein [Paenibacillus lemnae]